MRSASASARRPVGTCLPAPRRARAAATAPRTSKPWWTPNSSMKSAHAEIAVIQRAYEQGLTNAQKMLIVVRGEGVCSYCQRSDNLIAAAQRSGLSKLEIIDVERNTKMVWNRGEKSFFEVTLHE
ncbi:hypothetical protein I5U86_04820 [Stenotrophomonas maltophilia]|nr:hypothetical protein [Stenotrophomonas maltophilia]MBH1850587.1 hypothetical protein [Stenotrophomonas maltophilia]MCU1015410.1 hypothetical protein [Stenotrophomonas maltophilia]OMO39472.1 hypothetical protein BU225_18555 [Stenotrophomonas sp. MB339]